MSEEEEQQQEELDDPMVRWRGFPKTQQDACRYVEECRRVNGCPYAIMFFVNRDTKGKSRNSELCGLITTLHELRVRPTNPNKALFCAIVEGTPSAVRLLLKYGIGDPRGRLRDGYTMLHAAAETMYRWHTAEMMELVFSFASEHLDSIGHGGYSPLAVALHSGCTEGFAFLLRNGASTKPPACEHASTLRAAIQGGWDPCMSDTDTATVAYAYGCRLKVHDRENLRFDEEEWIDVLQSRVSLCGDAALAILGLRITGSRVCQSNGRDALRLIARMVWVYRVDEVWDYLQERLAWSSSEEEEDDDEEEEDSDQLDEEDDDEDEPPQKKVAV